jgi:hypothetical protein
MLRKIATRTTGIWRLYYALKNEYQEYRVSKPRKALVTKERTVHMYAELWHASSCVLEAGVLNQRCSSWQFLSSAVLTAFTFEAYLNHVGPQVIACWASLERLPPQAKFELLCETLKVEFPEGRGKRPLQTIDRLFEFRNNMAHGRSETLKPKPIIRDVNDSLDSYLGQRPLTAWEQLIQDNVFAKRAREDVEAVLNRLHNARPEPKEALFTFGLGVHGATLIEES